MPLKCMHCLSTHAQIHTNTHTWNKKRGLVLRCDWGCNSLHHVTSWWLFFTQPQRSMFWWHGGDKADMPWLKMHHATPGDGAKSEARRICAYREALSRELHLNPKITVAVELLTCLHVYKGRLSLLLSFNLRHPLCIQSNNYYIESMLYCVLL